MRVKSRGLVLIVLLSLFLLTCAGLNPAGALAGGSQDSARALDGWWDRLDGLAPGEIEFFFDCMDRANYSLWNQNQAGRGPVLSKAERDLLQLDFGLNYEGFQLVRVFKEYIGSHSSHGKTGYDGFLAAIQPEGRDYDYLAYLYEKLRDSLPTSFKYQLDDVYQFSESEQLKLFLQLTGLEFKHLTLAEVWPAVSGVFNEYMAGVSAIGADKIAGMGITEENLGEIADLFSPAEKENLSDILKKMGVYKPLPPAVVSGCLYHDLNGGGSRDEGEPGLAEWQITAEKGTMNRSVNTGAGGGYSFTFTEEEAGVWTISAAPRPGWKQTAPAGGVYQADVQPGADLRDRDFGSRLIPPPATLSGAAYNDLNGGGSRDEGEPGLAGLEIAAGKGTVTKSVYTGADGGYSFTFTEEEAGVWTISMAPQPGWELTAPAGGVYQADVQPGTDLRDRDFGAKLNPLQATLSGAAYLEGREDHSGVTVQAKRGESPEKMVSTAADGTFLIEGLPAGNYSLTYLKPGWLRAKIELALAAGESKAAPPVTLVLGDLNGDGYINVSDLLWIAAHIGLRPDMPGWDETADVNRDQYINVLDLVLVAKNIGA